MPGLRGRQTRGIHALVTGDDNSRKITKNTEKGRENGEYKGRGGKERREADFLFTEKCVDL